MSVIAGCSLFNGVMLASDCRMTIRKGSEEIYVDNVQKLFPLTNSTAIGFTGDIGLAGTILKDLIQQIRIKDMRRRADPVSLLRWFPRYFRAMYGNIMRVNADRRVDFLVGSVVQGRPNVIERSKVVDIMERFRLGQLSAQRNWMPNILAEIMRIPSNRPRVALLDVPLNLLYLMQAPEFQPIHVKPLEFCAIGSGENVVAEIEEDADWIFAGDVGNSFVEASGLRSSVSSFINRNQIASVGGLYPCLKINANGIEWNGYSTEIPVGGTKISLTVGSDNRWVQRNLSTGKEIKLLYPWEVDASEFRESKTFDDLKDLMGERSMG